MLFSINLDIRFLSVFDILKCILIHRSHMHADQKSYTITLHILKLKPGLFCIIFEYDTMFLFDVDFQFGCHFLLVMHLENAFVTSCFRQSAKGKMNALKRRSYHVFVKTYHLDCVYPSA